MGWGKAFSKWSGGKGQLGELGHPLLQGGRQMRTIANAAAERNRSFDEAAAAYAPVREEYRPYMDVGKKAASTVMQLFGDPSSIKGLPGYQFRYEEGQRAVETGAAAKGKLFSGQTLRELVTYGQEYATAELDKAFDRGFKGIQMGMVATQGYDAASLNMADIYAGRGQARARQYEDESRYLAGFEQGGREMFGSWFGGSGPFGQATGASTKGG